MKLECKKKVVEKKVVEKKGHLEFLNGCRKLGVETKKLASFKFANQKMVFYSGVQKFSFLNKCFLNLQSCRK